MRPARPMPRRAEKELRGLLAAAKSRAQYQRVQCVWLRATLGLSSEEVARAIGWHPASVRRVQAAYLREGIRALSTQGRGGRRHENLSLEEENALLDAFTPLAEQGGILEVSAVKAAYEVRLGHRVPKSTVYRMLKRHGWRKIAPRPKHPQSEPARQQAFKKNSASRLKRK
ncbi:MAG TPA: winged helix-turn-helix domain-containing protein [Candidatus Hydrogenedentes bacterium]|nr:winged helix-turn-helix domain-containing protein [Candidatus Hydrogenedentota bacterium]